MFTITNLCILLCVTCHFQAYGADKYTDENRPYEFGFTIEGEQHRHEKKDENGIIMGEFGFITADGVYHVTVYATDENGNFKILSMKNIRVKPYPTAPGVAERKSPPVPVQAPSPVVETQSAITPVASVGVRQGHSIPLASLQQLPADNKKQINVKNETETVRSCSHCKVPTTTTVAPKVVPAPEKQPISQNTLGEPEFSLRTPFENQFSPQSPILNVPSSKSVNSNPQTYVNTGNNNLQQSFNNDQFSVKQQPNAVNRPLVPNREQSIYDNNGSNKPTYLQNSNEKSDYQPNLYSRQNIPQVNSNPELSYPKTAVEETNEKQFPDAPDSNQFNVQNKKLQVPTIDQNYSPFSNAGQPNSLNSQEKLNEQNSLNSQENSRNNEQDQNISQVDLPPNNPNGYRHPKSFEEILQSANPNEALTEPSLPGANQTPGKPVLIAAQMQVVDKNTDIYHKNPGEVDGLPKGLNTGDVADLLYTFNYTVGFHGHHEKGYTNGVKIGYYYVTGRNGVRTRVDYVADQSGFRPKITQEVLDILSDEVPKPETEKDEKYGLKGYEFKWLYYPVESRRR